MPERGEITVREAGRLGGLRTRDRHGPEHFERIGRLGGSKVKRWIEAGQKAEAEGKRWETSETS